MNCPIDTFQCKSGDCISWDYVCDGIIQCQNGEDESICGKIKVYLNRRIDKDALRMF